MQSSILREISDLRLEQSREKFPNIPDHARVRHTYKQSDTNSLTQAIIDLIILKYRGYAVRINTQGQWSEKLKMWTKSTTRKGTADIHACINGRHYSIEVKTGRDTMSDEQKQTQADLERAGGVYILARNVDDVVNGINLKP